MSRPIELFFAHTIAPGFVAIMVPGTVLAVLAYFAWPLALVLLPFLLAVGLSPFIAGRVQERLGREFRAQLGVVNAQMVDSVQGLKEIVAFSRGSRQLAAIRANGEGMKQVRLRFLNRHELRERPRRGAHGGGQPGGADLRGGTGVAGGTCGSGVAAA